MPDPKPKNDEPLESLNRAPGRRGGLSTMCYINYHRSCLHHRWQPPDYCRCECHEREHPWWEEPKSFVISVACFSEHHETCEKPTASANDKCECECHT